MRQRFALGLVFICGVGLAPTAFGWGRDGHRLVALIAAHDLSPTAAAEVTLLLDGQSLAAVASLPDSWRTSEPETANWHFVDIPRSDTGYDESRDCPAQQSEVGKDCAVAALAHFISVLGDENASKEHRARALTFVVHFVGDVHQPLHNADDHDRGGNGFPVTWFGAATHTVQTAKGPKQVAWNLHAVWDEAIIERTGLSESDHLASLLAMAPPADAANDSVTTWVNDAYQLAKANAYDIPAASKGKPARLGKQYFATNRPVVDAQLLRAGLRLRAILEHALGTEAPTLPPPPPPTSTSTTHAAHAAAKAHPHTGTSKSPGDCDWSPDAHARKSVKERAPSLAASYKALGSAASPKTPAWFFDTACKTWQPGVADLDVGDDADVVDVEKQKITVRGWIVAVKFERGEDHDFHFELSGTKTWEPAGHLIGEIPGGSAYCEARKKLWELVSKDPNRKGDSFPLQNPVKVVVTGFLFFDSHHASKSCEASGGRGIRGPEKAAPNVKTVWELHPVIAVREAE